MWVLKFLSGPLAGQEFEVKPSTVIGRDPGCDIVIADPNVSKKHAKISVQGPSVFLEDLGSTNGTFVNGKRVQKIPLNLNDKISFYRHLAVLSVGVQENALAVAQKNKNTQLMTQKSDFLAPLMNEPQGSHQPVVWGSTDPEPAPAHPSHPGSASSPLNPDHWVKGAQKFIEQNLVPDILSLADKISLKGVFLAVAGLYVLLVSVLTVIPLYVVTKESITQEAQFRALSVARSLARINEERIRSNDYQKFSADLMYKEPGIQDVYVVSRDGYVVAPVELMGKVPRHAEFVNRIRGQMREFVLEYQGELLASVPIVGYDPQMGINTAAGFVIVSYRPDVLKFNDERVFSLFIQVIFIGLVAGAVLFFLLYKAIEFLFQKLFEAIDQAVRDGYTQIQFPYRIQLIDNLLTLVNTLLSQKGDGNSPHSDSSGERLIQLKNLCDLIPFPALILLPDGQIEHVNKAFQMLMEINQPLMGKPTIYQIPDQALQKNFDNILKSSQQNPTQVIEDEIELSGNNFVIVGQGFRLGVDQFVTLIRIAPKEAA